MTLLHQLYIYVPSKWDTCVHVCTSINVYVFHLCSHYCKLLCLRIKLYIVELMALYLMYVYTWQFLLLSAGTSRTPTRHGPKLKHAYDITEQLHISLV